MTLTDVEYGWIVGLLEGEGHFSYTSGTHVVALRMTDEDTVLRAAGLLQKITGKQHVVRCISQPVQPREDIYYVQLYGENARKVMKCIVRSMCYRRRQHIWRSLNKYKAPKIPLNISALRLVK